MDNKNNLPKEKFTDGVLLNIFKDIIKDQKKDIKQKKIIISILSFVIIILLCTLVKLSIF